MGLPQLPLPVLLVLGLAAAPTAGAAPITFPAAAQTGTSVRTFVNTVAGGGRPGRGYTGGSIRDGTTSTAASTATGPSHASASVNLLKGELKAFGSSTGGFSSEAVGWEFLTFDGSGTFRFSFDVDGTLDNSNDAGIVGVRAEALLFDVTTWTTYFAQSTLDPGYRLITKDGNISIWPFDYFVGTLGDVDNNRTQAGVFGARANPDPCLAIYRSCTMQTTLPLALAVTSSYTVEAGHLYLLQLAVHPQTFNPSTIGPTQTGDFTGRFRFTDLNGLTVHSASGQFLSQSVPVPEPVTMLLLGTGMVGAGLRRWRKRPA